jgi:hypothetical protein
MPSEFASRIEAEIASRGTTATMVAAGLDEIDGLVPV